MTYEEKKKLIEAENLLKENCIKKIKGAKKCDCVFANGENCTLLDNYPCDWYTPKLIRWTPEDIALAKALKDFGFSLIIRNDVGSIYYSDENGCHYRLPRYAFKNIGYSENVLIDTIIKEGEEDV